MQSLWESEIKIKIKKSTAGCMISRSLAWIRRKRFEKWRNVSVTPFESDWAPEHEISRKRWKLKQRRRRRRGRQMDLKV